MRFGPVYGEVRRARVQVFPYLIYFRVDGRKVRVVSVFHTSRDPATWQNRADEETA
jgi:toxin ParE1/3/4